MSYATRLAAMSREGAPKSSPRVIGGEAEAPREEHVESELRAPTPPSAPPRALGPRKTRPAPTVEQVVRREVPVQTHETHLAHETTEHTVIEHHETLASAPSAIPGESERERAVMPAAAQWLEEDRSAPDPLVEIAETDALRELMQRVRQWTSSAPTVIETEPQVAAAETAAPQLAAAVVAAPAVAAPTVAAPTNVSIGNVVITVEDAPVATPRGARAPSPARSTSDRMARNYIRGG